MARCVGMGAGVRSCSGATAGMRSVVLVISVVVTAPVDEPLSKARVNKPANIPSPAGLEEAMIAIRKKSLKRSRSVGPSSSSMVVIPLRTVCIDGSSIIKATGELLPCLLMLLKSHSMSVRHKGQLKAWDWPNHVRMHAECQTDEQPVARQGSDVTLSPRFKCSMQMPQVSCPGMSTPRLHVVPILAT